MKRKYYFTLFCTLIINYFSLFSQYCIPVANCSYNDYIDNFTFNSISNLSSGGSNCNTNSYIYTNMSTTVTKSLSYNMTMQSSPFWPQGFGVWIDYNIDGDFDDAGEFVYSSPNADTNVFSTTITIPLTAVAGTTRMRVRCIYGTTVLATESCTTFPYGETEDYDIIIQDNNLPPIAEFSSNTTFTCSGLITFFDQSLNFPTQWLWDFGDGNTDTVQNPTHLYASTGTYTVSLIVCNSNGCDAIVKSNYVTVTDSGPVTTNCYPGTKNYCCGFGITNVTFNTINNNSADGSVGYEDFSCNFQTNVLEGQNYNISVTTDSPAAHNIRVWIDYNNDGIIDNVNELVFSANQVLIGTGTISIPVGVVKNIPLRMRVAADYYLNSVLTPCDSPNVGQIEDYSVIVQDNTNPPIAEFKGDPLISCDGIINFTDLSTNIPSSWLWDFGDGNTSTQQNPTHIYSSSGTYTVTLIAYNSYGSDTMKKTNYINVNTNNQLITASCTPVTTAYCCNYGIYAVIFNTINNVTDGGIDSYQDYSCSQNTTIDEGKYYSIEIRTGPDNPEDVKVWLDLNNDGVLNDTTELIFSSNNSKIHSGNIAIQPGIAVLNTPLRMRVMSDFVGSNLSSCSNVQWGQVEDYGVTILPDTTPPVADFSADSTQSCSGTIQFTDLSSPNTTNWLWDFGDGNTDTLQNPVHTYLSDGIYTVTLTASNNWGNDVEVKNNYITVNNAFCTNTEVTLPLSGNAPVQTSCYGKIYDSGGPTANYLDGTDSYVTISPANAAYVSLYFKTFSIESGRDFLRIFDGPDTLSPLIGNYTGTALTGTTINSTGPSITVKFTSDFTVNDVGFEIDWSCVLTSIKEINNKMSFNIYPNPVNNFITFSYLPQNDVIDIYILNMLGQEILHKKYKKEKFLQKNINVSNFKQGLYFFKVLDGNRVLLKKLFIEN